jgi:hypothetical protein
VILGGHLCPYGGGVPPCGSPRHLWVRPAPLIPVHDVAPWPWLRLQNCASTRSGQRVGKPRPPWCLLVATPLLRLPPPTVLRLVTPRGNPPCLKCLRHCHGYALVLPCRPTWSCGAASVWHTRHGRPRFRTGASTLPPRSPVPPGDPYTETNKDYWGKTYHYFN